jgi:hypothetical protein
MNIEIVDIEKLKPADYNPRTITEKAMKGLKKSLKTFGIVDPIIVNKDFTVIGGHARMRAWQELGNKTIPCHFVDLDKTQEKKLNVVLNSQSISGTYDEIKLFDILEELKLEDDFDELLLGELLPEMDLEELEDKNKEISLEDLGDESILKLKFDMQTYLNVIQILNDLKTKNDFQSNEDLFLHLINYSDV